MDTQIITSLAGAAGSFLATLTGSVASATSLATPVEVICIIASAVWILSVAGIVLIILI